MMSPASLGEDIAHLRNSPTDYWDSIVFIVSIKRNKTDVVTIGRNSIDITEYSAQERP